MADIPAPLALLAGLGLAAFGMALLWLTALAIAHLAAAAWWIAVHAARLVVARRARPAEDRPAEDQLGGGTAGPVVWLACHTPHCGHMQTAHTPDPAGTGLWVCPGCHRAAALR
ncbi:hypothetical protein ACWC0A_18065 [Streptomyces scopuliridis]